MTVAALLAGATDDDGLDPVAGPLGLLVVVLLGLALVVLLRSLGARLRNVRSRAEQGGYTSSDAPPSRRRGRGDPRDPRGDEVDPPPPAPPG